MTCDDLPTLNEVQHGGGKLYPSWAPEGICTESFIVLVSDFTLT